MNSTKVYEDENLILEEHYLDKNDLIIRNKIRYLENYEEEKAGGERTI